MDKSKPTVGQRFNPFKVFNGVFVPDHLFCIDGLSDGARLCFGVLARFAGQDGRAYPSYERLASCLNRSRIQVMRRVRELVAVGLIEVEKTENTNRYHFLWHPIFDSKINNEEISTGIRCDTGGVSDMIPKENHRREENTNTKVNDRKTSHGTANSAANGNDVNDGFVKRYQGRKPEPTLHEYQKKKPIENVHEKAEKEFDAKELKLFKALINYKPQRGEPIIPREAYFWLKRYKYLNVVVAFEMFLHSSKSPKSVGAYLCKMIKDNVKPVESNYDKNRRLVVDYNKKDNILHMMNITRDYVSVEGREIDFRLDHNQFKMKFSNAVLR